MEHQAPKSAHVSNSSTDEYFPILIIHTKWETGKIQTSWCRDIHHLIINKNLHMHLLCPTFTTSATKPLNRTKYNNIDSCEKKQTKTNKHKTKQMPQKRFNNKNNKSKARRMSVLYNRH